jgi:hypothetical protein
MITALARVILSGCSCCQRLRSIATPAPPPSMAPRSHGMKAQGRYVRLCATDQLRGLEKLCRKIALANDDDGYRQADLQSNASFRLLGSEEAGKTCRGTCG